MVFAIAGGAVALSRGSSRDVASISNTHAVPMSLYVSMGNDRVTAVPDGPHRDLTDPPQATQSAPPPAATIRFQIRVSFPEDRVLTSPSLRVGTETGEGYLWPLDGVDHEGEDLDPLGLPANTKVLYEAEGQPDCSSPDLDPAIEFSLPGTLGNGDKVVATFVPSNPEIYEAAVRLSCDLGVVFQVGGGSLGDNGEARVAFLVNNPGAEPITVQIPALRVADVVWDESTFAVPAGGSRTVVVIGTGLTCGAGQPVPWEDGRVLIDGVPSTVPLVDAWQC